MVNTAESSTDRGSFVRSLLSHDELLSSVPTFPTIEISQRFLKARATRLYYLEWKVKLRIEQWNDLKVKIAKKEIDSEDDIVVTVLEALTKSLDDHCM